MIDGSEKRKPQLAFELQKSCVYEKRSNSLLSRKMLRGMRKLKPAVKCEKRNLRDRRNLTAASNVWEAAPRSLFCAANGLDDLSEMRFELAVNLIGLSNDGYF